MPFSPIVRRQEIGARASAVWDLITTPGHLEECHPFCASNPVDDWRGKGSQDRLEYFSGRTITRRFVEWQEADGYDIEITDATGRIADVAWRLSEQGGGSVLAIAITPHLFGQLPPGMRWVSNRAFVRPMLASYLRAVTLGVEWRVTTGRPVQRNQFGSHRWFSPPVTAATRDT